MAKYIDIQSREATHLISNLEPRWKPMAEFDGEDFMELGSIAEAFLALPEADVVPKGELDKYKVVNKLLEGDIADRDKMLEAKVEEVYADFMRDYKCMREELEGLYDLLQDARADNECLIKTNRELSDGVIKACKIQAQGLFGELDELVNWRRLGNGCLDDTLIDDIAELKTKYTGGD